MYGSNQLIRPLVCINSIIHSRNCTTLCTLYSALCTLYTAHGHSTPSLFPMLCLLWRCAVDSGGASCAGVLCATSPKHSVWHAALVVESCAYFNGHGMLTLLHCDVEWCYVFVWGLVRLLDRPASSKPDCLKGLRVVHVVGYLQWTSLMLTHAATSLL